VGVCDDHCLILRDSPLSTKFHLVFKFFPSDFSLFRVWEISVLSYNYEIPPFLIGLSVISYDIDYGTDILDQFSHSPYYIQEGEVVGGGLGVLIT